MVILRLLAVTAILVVALLGSVSGQILPGQTVTWSDFNYVYSVSCSMSRVYFATSAGIIVYNIVDQAYELPLTGTGGLDQRLVRRIWADQFDRKIYVRTDNGEYYEFDSFFEQWRYLDELPDNLDLSYVHVDNPDMILTEFDATYMGDGRFQDFYNRNFYTTDIIDNHHGELYCGTWGYGPGKIHSSSFVMELLPYGLLQENVSTLYLEDSILWVAGPISYGVRSGVSAFNLNANSFEYFENGLGRSFPEDDINCVIVDSTTLYVGTPIGLFFVDRESKVTKGPATRRWGLVDDNILSLARKDQSLFVGTAEGLNMIDLATDSVYDVWSNHLYQRRVWDLELIDDDIWMGTSDGAYRYQIETDKLQKYQDPEIVLFSDVFDVEEFEDEIWFSADAGIVRLDKNTGKSRSFQDALATTDSRPLAVNDAIVATASTNGVLIYFRGDKNYRSREFGVRDGLASDYVYELVIDGDYLWVGTDRGLTRFLWNNPDRVD